MRLWFALFVHNLIRIKNNWKNRVLWFKALAFALGFVSVVFAVLGFGCVSFMFASWLAIYLWVGC